VLALAPVERPENCAGDVLPRSATVVRKILWQIAGCMLASVGNAPALFEALTAEMPLPNNVESYCDGQ
jgi:hypothetical protein